MSPVLRRRGVLHGTGLAAFLAFVHLVNDAVTAVLGALLPTIQARFDASPTTLAVIVATYSAAASFTQPLLGALAEERGLRHVASLGVAMAALFLSLIGVAQTLPAVFALLVIGGIGAGALHPIAAAIVGSPAASNRTVGIGFFSTGGMIGFALGPVLILAVLSRFGVEATPWLMLPGVAISAAVFGLLPDWESHSRRPGRRLLDLDLLRGPVGLLTASGSLSALAFLTFTSTVPLWLVKEHGLSTSDPLIGWTLSVFALTAGAGSLLSGYVAPRLGRARVLVGSLALAPAPAAVVVALEPGSTGYFVATAITGALLYVGTPIKVVVAQDLAPDTPAVAAGTVLGFTIGVAGITYLLLGQIQNHLGLLPGMLSGFFAPIPAALIAALIFRRHPDVAGHTRTGRSDAHPRLTCNRGGVLSPGQPESYLSRRSRSVTSEPVWEMTPGRTRQRAGGRLTLRNEYFAPLGLRATLFHGWLPYRQTLPDRSGDTDVRPGNPRGRNPRDIP